jgi:anti-sigma B factor antagonist
VPGSGVPGDQAEVSTRDMDPQTAQSLHISVAADDGAESVHVVRCDGPIDTLTSGDLDHVIGALMHQGRRRLVIDLAGAWYVSSAGWGVFVSRLREARSGGGDITLARMVPTVHEVYDLLEFDGLLRHFDGLDQARRHFGSGAASPGTQPPKGPRVEARTMPPSVIAADAGSGALDDALLRLVREDPFYSLGELRTRLAGMGHPGVGRWRIMRALWQLSLLSRRRRFAFYRREAAGSRP